jgi:hypothetical protein
MAGDMAVPWQDVKSILRRKLEEPSKLITDLMDWASEHIGKSERSAFPLSMFVTLLIPV